ncbi:lasso peptide biosynthesis B2 protein [Streptomyces goshikiensis]|uniref:lasso peptide biosynthesis B2 protein n=1 Tax=Streptomyces goshikiensis TaxID=1942 RepID=UPI0036CDD05D
MTVTAPGASWGTHESAAQLDTPDAPPWPWRVAALVSVALTLAVRQTGRAEHRFGRPVRLAEAGSALPPASTAHARAAVRSVRWAARAVPARIACLEESTAASLLLAAGGRGNVWRHGVATDPIRLHAWIWTDAACRWRNLSTLASTPRSTLPTHLELNRDEFPAHPAAR